MTLLVLIQDAADLIGLPRPTAIMSSTDTQVRQLIACANREGKALAQRHTWTELQTEALHTTLAAELQGTVEAVLPGFNWVLSEVLWNRTQQDRVGGPLSPSDWQTLKASASTGPFQDFRIRGRSLYLFPAPAAGETVAIEYISRYWCESAVGDGQERWAQDDDEPILSDNLILLGIVWRFRQMKGLEYAEDFRTYELEVGNAISRDGGSRILTMSPESYGPMISAPEGNWTP